MRALLFSKLWQCSTAFASSIILIVNAGLRIFVFYHPPFIAMRFSITSIRRDSSQSVGGENHTTLSWFFL